jgi:hypothetical protein
MLRLRNHKRAGIDMTTEGERTYTTHKGSDAEGMRAWPQQKLLLTSLACPSPVFA